MDSHIKQEGNIVHAWSCVENKLDNKYYNYLITITVS